jgi:hypothetical protein
MASEIRVNQIQNRSGLSTVTFSDTGVVLSGITTVGILSATSITGNLTGTVNTSGVSTFSGGINVGATTSITVGQSFIRNNQVGLGQTTTTGRNAGIGTVEGTIIYNSTLREVQVYKGSIGWTNIGAGFIEATGGTISDYESSGTIYRAHVFTSSGTFSVTSAPSGSSVEYLVVAGGGGGGCNHAGGGGAGGFRTGTGIPVSSIPGS